MNSKIIVSRIVKCVVSNQTVHIQISILIDVFPLQYLSNKINYSISDFCSGYGCGNKLNVYTIYSSMQKVIYASFETDTFFRIIDFISIVITFLYYFPNIIFPTSYVNIFSKHFLGECAKLGLYFCIFTQILGTKSVFRHFRKHQCNS